MWLAVWITLLNAMGSSSGFINPARVTVGGDVPMGIMELSIAVAFIYAVFRGGSLQMAYPRLRTHPLLSWLMAFWGVTWLFGTVNSLGGMAGAREILQAMRDFALMPLCIFIGYRALSTPRSVYRMGYWIFAAGVGEAIVLLVRFRSASDRVQVGSDNVNPLRQVDFMTAYTSITFLVCMFSIMAGLRFVRPWLAAIFGSICLLGACSSVSRTTLVCVAFGFVTLFLLLPAAKWASAGVKSLLTLVVVAIALLVGIEIASDLTHRDFSKVMTKMVETVLPESEADGVKKDKAWDTRLPSLKVEFDLFLTSPLYGRGFTAISEYIGHGGTNWGAFGHNTMTSVMAKTGLIGIGAFLLLIFSMIVLGYRMCRESVDFGSTMFGVIGFTAGCNIFVSAICTMMFNARGAMYFALICGLVIRAREIQETTRELALTEPPLGNDEFDPYLQEPHHLGAIPNL